MIDEQVRDSSDESDRVQRAVKAFEHLGALKAQGIVSRKFPRVVVYENPHRSLSESAWSSCNHAEILVYRNLNEGSPK